MRLRSFAVAAVVSLPCAVPAQTPDASPTFEVASLKPAAPATQMPGRRLYLSGDLRGGPGTNSPGQATATGITLIGLLAHAYGMRSFQIVGPAWVGTQRYELTAKIPPGTTKEQFVVMLQNLLTERFHIVLRRETRELPVYALALAKNGPKLRESAPEPPADTNTKAPDTPPAPPDMSKMTMGADGFTVFPRPPGQSKHLSRISMNGRSKLEAAGQPMEALANNLTNQLSRPVIDETGLKGKYDFTLYWAADDAPPAGSRGGAAESSPSAVAPATPSAAEADLPSIFVALQSQLGLKLESKKAPVPMLVIDRADKVPVEN